MANGSVGSVTGNGQRWHDLPGTPASVIVYFERFPAEAEINSGILFRSVMK